MILDAAMYRVVIAILTLQNTHADEYHLCPFLPRATKINSRSKACLVKVLVGCFCDLKLHANRDWPCISRTGEHSKARFVLHSLVNPTILHQCVPWFMLVLFSCVLKPFSICVPNRARPRNLRSRHLGPDIVHNVTQHQ